ncbi:kinase-like protein [Trametes polyzona]|nr:kinase-like protein [Trametes polyzona]
MENAENNQWPPLEELFDVETSETIAESVVAFVTRGYYRDLARATAVAIKSASTNPKFSKQPHDIGKELRILMSLSHINVIDVLGYTYEPPAETLHFWMPFVPFHVYDILSSPHLSPYTLEDDREVVEACGTRILSFIVTLKSVLYQTLSAIAHVHSHGVAHRDIKPRNLLLRADGCVKLIDFGVAWSETPDARDLWPEAPGSMCFDVATGPYRAPELLFGATTYDARATDLWTLGAVFAEFFTPIRLQRIWGDEDDDSEEGDSDSEEGPPSKPPFIVPKKLDPQRPDIEWARDSLYDASRGAIGLAFSIFKIHGTPNEDTWPTFKQLPDAQKVTFVQVPAVDLRRLLPNLPPEGTQPDRDDCLDLVSKLLVYPPESRLRASDALSHPLFGRGLPLLLPQEYPRDGSPDTAIDVWDDRTLAEVLKPYLPQPPPRSPSREPDEEDPPNQEDE